MIISKMAKALKLGGEMTSGHFNQKIKGQPLQSVIIQFMKFDLKM